MTLVSLSAHVAFLSSKLLVAAASSCWSLVVKILGSSSFVFVAFFWRVVLVYRTCKLTECCSFFSGTCAAGSMAGHLLIRKVEKKSFSLTNWKKRRVVFSGARFVVYKPGQDSASECKKCAPGAVLIPVQYADVPLSQGLLLLNSSKVLPFQNDKKDIKTYGFRILHVTEMPARTYRQGTWQRCKRVG